MASLLTIPLELFVYISSFVSTPDLASLRLACKQTEKSLYEWFSNEFFVKKQFMLTQPSLQVLVDISKHASLSKRMKHVIIATNAYQHSHLHFRDTEALGRYLNGFADQEALLSTGIDREMLTEAFRNLENLETIDIRDFSARRLRDGTDWNSWGATTVLEETGIGFDLSNHYGVYGKSQYTSHIFSTLVYALGKSGRTPPRIEVLLRKQPAGLPNSSFHIADFMYPTCKPVLQNLTALFLTLDLTDSPNHTHGDRISTVDLSGLSLRRFLGYTRNLTHLRLNFQKHQIERNQRFIQWLGQPVRSESNALDDDLTLPSAATLHPAPIDLPLLKELDLGLLNIAKQDLIAIVIKFSSRLEALSLWRMTITKGSPALSWHTSDTNHNLWFDFFKTLENMPFSKLDRLKLMKLSQRCGSMTNFISEAAESRNGQAMEYSGKELKKFLTGLEEYMPADWPEMISIDPENSGSDEGSDEGSNDENDEDDNDGDGEDE